MCSLLVCVCVCVCVCVRVCVTSTLPGDKFAMRPNFLLVNMSSNTERKCVCVSVSVCVCVCWVCPAYHITN